MKQEQVYMVAVLTSKTVSLSPGQMGRKDTLPIRNNAPLGPYGRTMPGTLWWP